MATQGTEKVLGGTPYKRYPDPASPGTANAYGLYPWSVFSAVICSYDAGTLSPYEGLNNVYSVHLLLFTSDIPAMLEFRATDLGTTLQFSSACVNTLSVPFLFTTPAGSTTPTIPVQGKVISGYAGAAVDVYCSGFPAAGNVVAPGESGAATYTELICTANAAVIAAPVGALSFFREKDNFFAPVPDRRAHV